jgi:hypothetical protein
MQKLILWIVGVTLALLAVPAEATNVEQRLTLAVAQVCVNEAGFDSPADCALVWQTAENRAETTRGRLFWLQQHSRRVLGDRPCRRGNCRWSRHLGWNSRMPTGWPRADVAWRPERWALVRDLAQRLVRGEELRRPCPAPPFTWGGRMDFAGAQERGLVRLHCEGTLNEGFALPTPVR